MSILTYFIDSEVPLLSRRPRYPATLCKLEYLDEGGANTIWRISVTNGVQAPARLHGMLLRLRKNLRHVQPAEQQMKAFDDNFKNLFAPEHLVQHRLIRLDEGVIPALNDLLKQRNRPSHRAQDFLSPDEQHGMLITDMSATSEDETLTQLKPKWLAQSPDAPSDSRRCRTCALRASRLARKAATATDEQRHCPLMLVNPVPANRHRAAQGLTKDEAIAHYLAEDAFALLVDLRKYQAQLDPNGVFEAKGVDDMINICRAMTLRDCTLYLKRTGSTLEARLGDLDLKQPAKMANWRSTERALIDEGWYTNTEAEPYFTIEVICALSGWQKS